jgi:hypothetical protein
MAEKTARVKYPLRFFTGHYNKPVVIWRKKFPLMGDAVSSSCPLLILSALVYGAVCEDHVFRRDETAVKVGIGGNLALN